jgi:hypothetical protein
MVVVSVAIAWDCLHDKRGAHIFLKNLRATSKSWMSKGWHEAGSVLRTYMCWIPNVQHLMTRDLCTALLDCCDEGIFSRLGVVIFV